MRKEEGATFAYAPKEHRGENRKSNKISALEKLLDFDVYDFTDSVIYALIAVTVFFVLFARVFSVNGTSMVPTLHDDDKVVVSSVSGSYKKGDVVVIGRTPSFSESLVKRIIAEGGDTVYVNFSTGKVYVNDAELVEYYVNTPTERQYDIAFPITVPEGSVFLLGDNRNDSLDSRSSLVGCVAKKNIIGKVLFKLDFGNWKVE